MFLQFSSLTGMLLPGYSVPPGILYVTAQTGKTGYEILNSLYLI